MVFIHLSMWLGACVLIFSSDVDVHDVFSGAQYFVVRNSAYQLRPASATRRSSYTSEALKLPENVRTMVSLSGMDVH